MKNSFLTKLKDIGIPLSVAAEFISDIFERRAGSTYEKGLVDSDGAADFDARLQKLPSCLEYVREFLPKSRSNFLF